MSDFPNKLKKLRTDYGLTQLQLAKSLHVSQNAIYNWENGKREPNLEMVKKIANTFKIELYLLIDDNYKLPDINLNSEAWKNRARFLAPEGYAETIKPPGPFTTPASQSSINTTTKSHDASNAINQERLDDKRFSSIMRKIDRGTRLSPQEIEFKTAYLENAIRKIGEKFAEFYSMLNDEGKKIADEQISRAIEQVMLLTKIPEYRKGSEENN